MENRGEVCLEEEVGRMRRSGMSKAEIAETMGVHLTWVESLISMWEGEGFSTEENGSEQD